jgi:PQQ-dependent dehydrogenase (methanol/ethanol family)
VGDLEHTVASRFRRPSGLFCRAFFSLMMSPLLACLNAFAPTLAASQPISSANVSTLRPVLVFQTGSPRGHAGSPTVSGDTLFVLTPFPHTLYAFDTRRPGFPRKWTFRPKADGRAEGLACCDTLNAGPTISGKDVFITTLDGHVIALDAETGSTHWDVAPADLARGETLTGSPIVAGPYVLVGDSGDDYGARGWIAALDTGTGQEVWRRFSTGRDLDVGIDTGTTATGAGPDAGVHSWSNEGWLHGGGEVSGPIVADSEGATIYHGAGHAAPWNPDQRFGDNRWTSSLFARDVKTGAVRWVDQLARHDDFALGSTGALLPVDRDWYGATRKLLIHPDRNGYLYVIDRTTGAVLSADAFTTVNETSGVDLTTGATIPIESRKARLGATTRDICPAWPGATVGGAALSADANLVFIPVSKLCMDFEARNVSYISGTAFVGANMRAKRPSDGMGGALVAWDISAGKAAWSVAERFPVAGGVLATNDLIFYGTLDGAFKALDAKSGRELWRFQASSGIIGQPIAFRGPDDRDYVAVLAGLGGPFGVVARNGIDRRDATAAHGMANALADLPEPIDPSGTLYVFGLP